MWFLNIFWPNLASNHDKIPFLPPEIAFKLQISSFYTEIRLFGMVIDRIKSILGLENAIFSHFDVFFACFLCEGGPKNFFSPKFFFFEKFDPSWFQNALYGCHSSFLPIILNFLAKPKKSFLAIFPYYLGSSQKGGSKNGGVRKGLQSKLSKSFKK